MHAKPVAQDLSCLVSDALIRACNASQRSLTQTWLRAANAFSFQHKHQGISLLDAQLLSRCMALQPNQTPWQADHTALQDKLTPRATRMLFLFVAKICKESLPDSRSSYLDIVHPGSSLEQLTSTLNADVLSANGTAQQSAHKSWMQAQHTADRSCMQGVCIITS